MNLKEIVGSEAYEKLPEDVKSKYGKANLQDVSEGKYVPKSRLDDEIEKTNHYKSESEEYSKQLNKLKDEYKDAEGLKDQVDKLQSAIKNQKEEFEKLTAERAFNSALERSLSEYKVKDSISVLAHINKENLKLDADGKKVIGLDEQIKELQKSCDYLFEKEIGGTGSFGAGYKGGEPTNKFEETDSFAVNLGKSIAAENKAGGLDKFYAK